MYTVYIYSGKNVWSTLEIYKYSLHLLLNGITNPVLTTIVGFPADPDVGASGTLPHSEEGASHQYTEAEGAAAAASDQSQYSFHAAVNSQPGLLMDFDGAAAPQPVAPVQPISNLLSNTNSSSGLYEASETLVKQV